MKKTFAIISAALALAACGNREHDNWIPLFNGENLDNWEAYLGPPFEDHKELAQSATPDNVFSVVDIGGEKAIRISGEIFGALATKESFGNFHARVVMKWGESVTESRNCGLLYHGQGPFGAAFGTWKSSVECQLKSGDMGGLYIIGDSVTLHSRTATTHQAHTYKPGAAGTTFGEAAGRRAIQPGTQAENPVGQWNTIDIYCVGQKSVHVVNGKVTMRADSLATTQNGNTVTLTGGCLQLQSEGAELFVRSVEIQPIDEIPASVAE